MYLFGWFLSVFLSSPQMGFHLITRGVLSTHVLITQPGFPKSDKLLTGTTRVFPTEDFLQAILGQSPHRGSSNLSCVDTHTCLFFGLLDKEYISRIPISALKNLSKSFP